MTAKFSPGKSRLLWLRRLAWREKRLAAAHRTGNRPRIVHWTPLVKEAQLMVDKRRAQTVARLPLRLRAWREMTTLLNLKVSEVGGNNIGPMVNSIIRANGGTPGEPWCGDTVAYCYLRAGSKSVVRAWAAVRLLLAGHPTSHPRRGDVVRYAFDHVGLFDRWAPERGPGYFYAGEGNTGDAGAVSDSQTGHDGVKLKRRHMSQVRDFRRIVR